MNKRIVTTHSESNPLIVALRANGVEVERIDWNRVHDFRGLDDCLGFYGNLFQEIKNLPKLISLRTNLRKRQVPYIFWNRDAPWNVGMKTHRRLAVRWLRIVDIYLAHSLQDSHIFSNNSYYFPNAASRAYYSDTNLDLLRNEALYENDVSFFGAIGNVKRRGCRERVGFFSEVERRVKREMPSARFKIVDTVHRAIGLEEQLHLIRTSKINLNFGAMCDLPGHSSWGMPERVFGIPAAGGFLLTDFRRSIPETFANDACDYFSDAEDCAKKILSSLSSFKLLRERAEEMHRQVITSHTYEKRAAKLMELILRHRNKGETISGISSH